MNESDQHDRSASVSERRKRLRTQPALDVRSRWLWTEGSVWTDRMLTALEQGVKGGKMPTLPIAGFSTDLPVISIENIAITHYSNSRPSVL